MEDYKEKIRNLYNKVRFSALLEDSLLAKKLEDVFPELKESEDERIINYIKKAIIDYWSDEPLEEILDWLEKQVEHANFRNKIQVGDKVTRNEDGVLVNLSQLNRVAKSADKQGVQKPADEELKKLLRAEYEKGRAKGKAQTLCEMPKEIDSQVWQIANNAAITWEQSLAVLMAAKNAYDKGKADAIAQNLVWGEGDENMLSDIVDCIKNLPIFYESVNINGEDKIAGRFICDAVNWLKSLKDRVQPLPKQEWSEEDEEMRNFVTNIFKDSQRNGVSETIMPEQFDKIFNWLKHLSPMNNPVEWSMEDEEELEIALDTLKKAGQYSSAEWLKNVCLVPQSHWKPSEDQMEILHDAIGRYEGLGSLYEDLKKL